MGLVKNNDLYLKKNPNEFLHNVDVWNINDVIAKF